MIAGIALSGSPPVIAIVRWVCRSRSLRIPRTAAAIPPISTMPEIKTRALPRERIAPSRIARARDPSPRKIEREAEIDQSGRHPHHEPGELLVLQRREPADRGELALLRIPRLAREG